MTTHKEALKQAYDVFCGMSMDDEFSDMETAIRAYLDARGLVMVPKDVEYDEALNNMGWDMNAFLSKNGAQFDGRVFNHIKGHLKNQIEVWISSRPDPFKEATP